MHGQEQHMMICGGDSGNRGGASGAWQSVHAFGKLLPILNGA